MFDRTDPKGRRPGLTLDDLSGGGVVVRGDTVPDLDPSIPITASHTLHGRDAEEELRRRSPAPVADRAHRLATEHGHHVRARLAAEGGHVAGKAAPRRAPWRLTGRRLVGAFAVLLVIGGVLVAKGCP